MLKGKTILDVYTAQHVTFLCNQHIARGKHPVNIENECFEGFEFLERGFVHVCKVPRNSRFTQISF
jgi:hypothetical protein